MAKTKFTALTREALQQVNGGGIGEQFSGLPMASLLGAPLQAAADAQCQFAKATQAFIDAVGLSSSQSRGRRTTSFSYARHNVE